MRVVINAGEQKGGVSRAWVRSVRTDLTRTPRLINARALLRRMSRLRNGPPLLSHVPSTPFLLSCDGALYVTHACADTASLASVNTVYQAPTDYSIFVYAWNARRITTTWRGQ